MVAFAVSLFVTVILVWGFYAYLRRCPAEKEFTWGEAMVFATYVFFILFWVRIKIKLPESNKDRKNKD